MGLGYTYLILFLMGFIAVNFAHSPFEGLSMPSETGGYETLITHEQVTRGPLRPIYKKIGSWYLTLQELTTFVYDRQGGPRGASQPFSGNFLFFAAERPVTLGKFIFETELSLEPATIGKCGYPLLFATGDTANGKTPLLDSMHPRTLISALVASYVQPLSQAAAGFVYFGYPGTPPLGPLAFHNYSGIYIPEASITHHWLDSTHISFGVATVGVLLDRIKIEGSIFNGREPQVNYWKFRKPQFDSYCARFSVNPSANWGVQISAGHLKEPEILEPGVNVNRVTASFCYNKEWNNSAWYNTLAWGRNSHEEGHTLNALLAQTTVIYAEHHAVLGRAEWTQNNELLGHAPIEHMHESIHDDEHRHKFHNDQEHTEHDHQPTFNVGKIGLGYMYRFDCCNHLRWSIGLYGTVALVPSGLKAVYGNHPFSWLLFLQIETC